MKKMKRILLALVCAAVLALSWLLAVTSKSNEDRQRELLEQAEAYMEDEVYILAAPLLEEAVTYRDRYREDAEAALKEVYLALMDQSGYSRKYESLLATQMAREGAKPEIFLEAAEYYLSDGDVVDALNVLKDGIAKTGDEELVELYEASRYAYTTGWDAFEDVTSIYEGTVSVMLGGLWGTATAAGEVTVPCRFEAISTFSGDRAIVALDGEIFAVDSAGNRLALEKSGADAFLNYSQERTWLHTEDGWLLANNVLRTAEDVLMEAAGMFSDGYAPAMEDGKWGMIDTSGSEWLFEPEYDGIITDGLGRAFAQSAVFVVDGDEVVLLVEGDVVDSYEDARPFADGWAAVKRGGKWGFVDTEGEVMIDFQFEDALSFGQHLAAVQVDGLWGYVSLSGELVIPAQYLEARSFNSNSAPVKTEKGWQFITLLEE